MLNRLFRRGRRPDAAPARTAAGERIYCIGDIHGRADLLGQVADWIAADVETAPGAARAILLGDYIDRGPDSAAVLERLSTRDFPVAFTALSGNHEQIFLSFLDDPQVLDSWRRFGGLEMLHSYGVPVGDAMRGEKYAEALAALRERQPERHVAFLKSCPLWAESGDYFFCHAGVRPDAPLAQQSADDLLWIRKPFLTFEGAFGKTIVHGHTPVERPDLRPNRINIDTGAYATGALTCLALEGESVRLFTTG